MGAATIIGEGLADYPRTLLTPFIQTMKEWTLGDDGLPEWQADFELTFCSAEVHASSAQVSILEFKRRYGKTKEPYENDFSIKPAKNLSGQWASLWMWGDDGTPALMFAGRIEDQARDLMGKPSDGINPALAAGIQTFIAAGPLRILQKITVSEAIYLVNDDDEEADQIFATVQHIPAMNARDHRALFVGNRSDLADDQGVFYYGGKQTWTHGQYLKYVVANFVQQYEGDDVTPTGPIWTIGGQKDILELMTTTIKFPQVVTVAEMCRLLIPVKYGVDFFVHPTPLGFEITVFALSSLEGSIAGATMPKNPNTVQIDKGTSLDMVKVHLVESGQRRYDSIRVLGKRIVVCGSLRATDDASSTLIGKWSDAIEAAYKAETSGDTDANDKSRQAEKYRNVFQLFGAPADWDLDGGKWAVQTDFNGTVISTPGDYQNVLRETLHWIPLKEGFDYRNGGEADGTLGTSEPDVKSPMAWIKDYDNPAATDDNPIYVACHFAGIHVQGVYNDWGIFLSASPNHLLDHGDWDDDAAASNSSDVEARFDYTTLIATIAIESDSRLQVGFDLPADQQAGDGSIMTVLDEEAECWVMLGGTVVDLDASNKPVTGGSDLRILRNDNQRLALVAAGEYVRYINERIKAQIDLKGLFPWGNLIGSILTMIVTGDDQLRVGAPITSVFWTAAENSVSTIMRTGYA